MSFVYILGTVANCPPPLFQVICSGVLHLPSVEQEAWSGLWVAWFGLTLLHRAPSCHGQYQVFVEFNYNSLKFYRHYQLLTLKVKLSVILPAIDGLIGEWKRIAIQDKQDVAKP